MARKKLTLGSILDVMPYMKIAIDEQVDTDAEGNYLVNFGYLRVSTDKQADEGYGLDIQENKVVTYCKSMGYKNLVLFIDDGYTGTKMTDRPALAAVMAFIDKFNDGESNIRIDTFIVPRMDRLGRTLLGTLQFIQDYIVCAKDAKQSTINRNKEDINFISVAEPACSVSPNNAQGKFLLTLFASLAEYDRDLIVRKLKDGMIARVEEGKWPGGGMTPYGYYYDDKADTLIVIPEQAEKIREVFRLYIEEKMSPAKIATRLGFKGEKIVLNILKRKSLTGCIEYKGKEYKGLHEPIIPLERWEEAQRELENRSVNRADSEHLLSGLLYCGECGSRMRYQKWNKYGDCKIVCYSTQKSTRESKPYLVKSDSCSQERFWASDVEDAVAEALFEMSYLANTEDTKAPVYIDPFEAIEKELKSVKSKLSKLLDLEDDFDDDILREKIQTLSSRKRELERQLSDEQARQSIQKRVDHVKDTLRTLKETWPSMTPLMRQSTCRDLIEKVIIDKEKGISIKLKLHSFLMKKEEIGTI